MKATKNCGMPVHIDRENEANMPDLIVRDHQKTIYFSEMLEHFTKRN